MTVDNFRSQNRGGKGIKGMQTIEDDYIEEDEDGRQVAWANVLTHERETELLGKAL